MYLYEVTREAAGFKHTEIVEAGDIRSAAETLARGELTKLGNTSATSIHPQYLYRDSHNDALISVQAAPVKTLKIV